MNTQLVDSLVQIINSLTEEERENLKTKLARSKEKTTVNFIDEPFVGMWKDREDIADSSNWVRKLRQSQWNRDE